MAPKTITVTEEGILKGIPIYDENVKGLTAIVTGANGISGNAMTEWLAAHPQRWSKVHALSRRKPYKATGGNVQHHAIDLLNTSTEDLTRQFKDLGISADYIFHFAYTDSSVTGQEAGNTLWSATDGLVNNNTFMLSNVIQATAAQDKKLKRVMLQTGTKNYGFHMGPILSPGTEGDPKPDYEANFYYAQEAELQKLGKKFGYEWTVVRPSFIVGCPKELNALNAALAYALYIAISKEMGEAEVEFLGTYTNYVSYCDQSYAPLNACFEEYSVLTKECANQDFNIQDGDVYTWSRGFPLLAKYFGTKVKKLTGQEKNEAEFDTRTPAPRDGLPSSLKNRIVATNWAKQPKVKEAWDRLQKRHDLQPGVFEKTWWPLLDFLFGIQWDCNMSMTKCRDYGFFGYCDSTEAHYEMFREAARNKLLPPESK